MSDNQQYHHGDLRNKLLALSHKMLQEGGLKGLSLRKLAERAGVSRTALYHHFNNKNDLLAAVAEQGFESLTCQLKSAVGAKDKSIQERLEQTVQCYLRFAMDNVTQYELMFGRELWRDHPSERLQRTAKDCFRAYAKLPEAFHQQGLLKAEDEPLRLAQVMWSTLHGLVKLAHDGVVLRKEDLLDISRYALAQLLPLDSEQANVKSTDIG
jgi:AcrR family transcriptional regulator